MFTTTTASTTTTTIDPTIDESALALLEAGLYSVPTLGTLCDFARTPAAAYLNPARGGDTYGICIPNMGPFEGRDLTPATLSVTWPGAAAAIEIGVAASTDDPSPDRYRLPVVLTHPDGRRRATGQDYWYGESPDGDHFVSFPMFLPHGRPAGTWKFVYEADGVRHEFSARIDRGCPTTSTVELVDPLILPADLEFTNRSGPAEFPTCRITPDVTGLPIDDAIDVMQNFFDVQDISATFRVTPECSELGVQEQFPRPGLWFRELIDSGTADAWLRSGVDCPHVPSLVPLPFEEAVDVLAAVAAEYPYFTWTADESCAPGTIVVTQDPVIFPGRTTTAVDIVRCS